MKGKVIERGKVIHPVFHLTASLALLHSTRVGFGGLAYMRALLLVFVRLGQFPTFLGECVGGDRIRQTGGGTVRTASNRENGVVAILDALGTATYGESEIERFIESRQVVLGLLDQKAEDILGEISKPMITTFTFNDTVLVILKTGDREPRLRDTSAFFTIMRKFLVDSLGRGILFRGSIAIGTFYANEDTNTVMGQAVTDAAAWYDKAEWIGVHATPRASMLIDRWLERKEEPMRQVMLDYDIPLKESTIVRAKAINWPKAFFVESITPCTDGTGQKEKLFEFLTQHQVPWGTERKFYNTVAFFDHAVKQIKKSQSSIPNISTEKPSAQQ